MSYFKNINWNGKRDYESTNVVACEAEQAPNANYAPMSEEDMNKLFERGASQLWIQGGVRYFGWL